MQPLNFNACRQSQYSEVVCHIHLEQGEIRVQVADRALDMERVLPFGQPKHYPEPVRHCLRVVMMQKERRLSANDCSAGEQTRNLVNSNIQPASTAVKKAGGIIAHSTI